MEAGRQDLTFGTNMEGVFKNCATYVGAPVYLVASKTGGSRDASDAHGFTPGHAEFVGTLTKVVEATTDRDIPAGFGLRRPTSTQAAFEKERESER